MKATCSFLLGHWQYSGNILSKRSQWSHKLWFSRLKFSIWFIIQKFSTLFSQDIISLDGLLSRFMLLTLECRIGLGISFGICRCNKINTSMLWTNKVSLVVHFISYLISQQFNAKYNNISGVKKWKSNPFENLKDSNS